MSGKEYLDRLNQQRRTEDEMVLKAYRRLSERGLKPLQTAGVVTIIECIEDTLPQAGLVSSERINLIRLVAGELASPELFDRDMGFTPSRVEYDPPTTATPQIESTLSRLIGEDIINLVGYHKEDPSILGREAQDILAQYTAPAAG